MVRPSTFVVLKNFERSGALKISLDSLLPVESKSCEQKLHENLHLADERQE